VPGPGAASTYYTSLTVSRASTHAIKNEFMIDSVCIPILYIARAVDFRNAALEWSRKQHVEHRSNERRRNTVRWLPASLAACGPFRATAYHRRREGGRPQTYTQTCNHALFGTRP
jgi:hypothetical protein